MNTFQLIDIAFRALDQRDPRGAAATALECNRAEQERPSPCDDARTAGVVYPVTCLARYYDAASRILEEEGRLHRHACADELGHVIQDWIERKRNNLGLR